MIPPAEAVRKELAEAVRRVRLLKQLLKIAEDNERKRPADPARADDAGL